MHLALPGLACQFGIVKYPVLTGYWSGCNKRIWGDL